MPSNRLNVYADSDFFPESLEVHQLRRLDLTQFEIYQVNGEAMVKLSDLQALNISVQVVEGGVVRFPEAA